MKIFRAHFVFQGKRKLLKNPERQTIFQHSGKVQSNSAFQGKRYLFEIPNDKKSVTSHQARQGRECLPYHNNEMCKTNQVSKIRN